MEGPYRPTPGECGGWHAWHYHRPSGPEPLNVTGNSEFPTLGYPSSPATQLRIGANAPFARLATPGYFLLRSREASRRKISRQFVSDLCPDPSTNLQQSIAVSSRSLRCTQTGATAEQVRTQGSRRAQEERKIGDVSYQDE